MDELDVFLDELDLATDIETARMDRAQLAQLASIHRLIKRQGDRIMADITALAAELVTLQNDTDAAAARVQASLDALSAQVADLQVQIAALSVGAVTQDQIDALDASATAIDSGINAIDPTVTPTT